MSSEICGTKSAFSWGKEPLEIIFGSDPFVPQKSACHLRECALDQQHYVNGGFVWVVRVELLKPSGEFNATMAVRDVGKHVPGVQIDPGQDRFSIVPATL